MGRTPGSKNKPKRPDYRPFENITHYDKGFVRLPFGMLNHPVTRNLPGNAFKLLVDMRRVAAGKEEFIYSRFLAQKIFKSNQTFEAARNHLIAAGFITYDNAHCARDKRETAHFTFSDQWYKRQ